MFSFRRFYSLLLLPSAFALFGCAASDMQKVTDGLKSVNQVLAGGSPSSGTSKGATLNTSTMAANVENATPAKVMIPNDTRVQNAVNAALPTIKEIVAIHQCIKDDNGLLRLNAFAVPGVIESATMNLNQAA